MSVLMANRPTSARIFSSLPDRETANALLGEIAAMRADLHPRMVDRPLALYGAGDLGRMARAYLAHVGVQVDFVIDRNADRLAELPEWRDVPLLKPDAVPERARRSMLLAVCVATAPYAPLEAELSRAGWCDVVPFYDVAEAYRDRHPLSNGWFAPSFSERALAALGAVLAGWADDRSRAYHLQFITWRRLREEWIFDGAPVTTYDRYFIPEVRGLLTDREAFADIGAYDGGVVRRFLEVVKGRRGPLWAIEPDPRNLARLRETFVRLSLAGEPDVRIIASAVADVEGEVPFAAGLGYASQISELGQSAVAVTTIDRLEIAPSFLKLHLEGGEYAALRGARAMIARCRPLLAVTSYHNALGLWELPLWLMEALPDYRFLMRLHSWVGTGALIYGIPRSRHRAKAAGNAT